MADQIERFTINELTCPCGTELRLHIEYIEGAHVGNHPVHCPICKRKLEWFTTKPLRFFFKEKGNEYWVAVPGTKWSVPQNE